MSRNAAGILACIPVRKTEPFAEQTNTPTPLRKPLPGCRNAEHSEQILGYFLLAAETDTSPRSSLDLAPPSYSQQKCWTAPHLKVVGHPFEIPPHGTALSVCTRPLRTIELCAIK